MRNICLTCLIFLVFGASSFGQNAPINVPKSDPLDQVLHAWEQRMSGIDRFSTTITRTELHPLTKKATTFVGEAAFMKPNLARFDLTHIDEIKKPDADKTNFERFYCDGYFIYEFSPKEKLLVRHTLPSADAAADSSILSFLRGMKAADLRKRFDVTLLPSDPKENGYYAHLRLTPKLTSDKQDFTGAVLALWAKNPNQSGQPDWTMLPCQLKYAQPNGKEVSYKFSDMNPDAKLGKASFAPRLIEGYKRSVSGAP